MHILDTGAAGLIGQPLVARLAASGHDVTALAHRSPPGPSPGPVTWLRGDVRQPSLGLPQAALAGLDLIVHCAAVTAFNLPPETYREINIGGTANVISLAKSANARLLHVSTAYVCGNRDGPITEHEPSGSEGFANGYEASKAEAEALVADAGGAIARPSIVTGAWTDGAIAVFGGIYQLLRLIATGRVGILPVTEAASLDLVPIDYVVAGICDLAERIERAVGQTFHLVSGAPVPIAALCALSGHYRHFCTPRLVASATSDEATLALERALGPVAILYKRYLQRDPQFQARNLTHLTGRICPPVDTAYLRRLIDYAIGAGFLPRYRTSG